MKANFKLRSRGLASLILICSALIAVMAAQVKETTSTEKGSPSQTVTVERGEVVSVAGTDLFVKMEDGQVRHFANIPETSRVSVDGQQLGIHDLKPGMKLERTIRVTTTPQTVRTVQTVTGKVWHVQAPSSVTLTLENGENQTFRVPKDQKFMIDGQETTVFDLKKGMTVSATKVVEVPEAARQETREVTGTMPPPPLEPLAAAGPVLIYQEEAVPQPQETEAASARLPQTGSSGPAIALLGLLILTVGFSYRQLWS